jgi:hypothetical protein
MVETSATVRVKGRKCQRISAVKSQNRQYSSANKRRRRGASWHGPLNVNFSGSNGNSFSVTHVPTTVTDIPIGTYSPSYISGGPTGAGSPIFNTPTGNVTQSGQWLISFSVDFAGSAPIVTQAASGVTSDSATMNGSVNSGGALGTAFFQIGTESTLSVYAPNTPSVQVSANYNKTQEFSMSTTTVDLHLSSERQFPPTGSPRSIAWPNSLLDSA